jgi:gamma-glutamyltranspeptidase/glutathione hydrolase
MDALATASALETLQRGGNAVDAAVAAAAALGVTEPFSCGIGGGGFMVIYLSGDRGVVTVDHRERAPRAFTSTSLQDHGESIPFAELQTSTLATGVPGTVRGWEEALRRYGRMALDAVLEPAIRVAEDGFTVDAAFHQHIQENVDRFRIFPSTRELFLAPTGNPLPVGSLFRNPALAEAYRLLARLGGDAFYRGAIANAMVAVVRRPPVDPASGRTVRAGLLTADDVSSYAPLVRPTLETRYKDYTIHGVGRPSSGGVTMALVLNLLEGLASESVAPAQTSHSLIEACRLAFADRGAHIGDVAGCDASIERLVSKAYAAERQRAIGEAPTAGPAEAGDLRVGASSTTHLTVCDRDGNIVSYTFTIGSIGGSGIVVPGYGFILNSELTDFDPVQSHVNAPGPGKRPRSSMTPTIVFKNGAPVVALGAAGGTAIISAVLQTLLHTLERGLSLDDAIAAPRLFQHNTGATFAERAFLESTDARALMTKGHQLAETASAGEVTGVRFAADGRVTAAAERVRQHGGSAQVEEPA